MDFFSFLDLHNITRQSPCKRKRDIPIKFQLIFITYTSITLLMLHVHLHRPFKTHVHATNQRVNEKCIKSVIQLFHYTVGEQGVL